MLSCVAAGVAAGAVGIAVAYLLHRRAERERGAEKVMQAGEGSGPSCRRWSLYLEQREPNQRRANPGCAGAS